MNTRLVLMMLALCLCELTAAFESTMVFAALPKLIGILGDPAAAGWLVTAHMLVTAGTALVAARLGDLRGRRGVMIVLLGVAGLGSVIAATSTSYWTLLLGRALQGAIGAMLPLGIGIVRASLPSHRARLGVGILVTAQGAGSAAGLVLGGAIIDRLDWHWLFGVAGIMLFLSLVAVRLFVPDQPGSDRDQKVDWIDGLLPVPCISALVFGLTLTKSLGWGDWRVVALMVGATAGLAFWGRRNLASASPFIDLRLLKNRNVAIGNLISALLALGTLQAIFIFSTLMQAPRWTIAGLGLTALAAGLAKLPSNVVSFTAGPLAGWMAQRIGDRRTLVFGSLLLVAGWSASMLMPGTVGEVVALLCVISFATTFLMTATPNLVMGAVPPDRTSEAVALLAVLRGMFMAVGAQIVAMFLATELVTQDSARYPATAAYQWAMGWVAGLSVLVGLLALAVRPGNDPAPAAATPEPARS